MSLTKLTDEKKEAARWKRILRVYGITKEQYDELDTGFCFVCQRVWDDSTRPCVDHDHVTGEVRGLLCIYCNRYRVGRQRDGDIAQRVADYLKAPRRGWIVPKRPKRRTRKKKV